MNTALLFIAWIPAGLTSHFQDVPFNQHCYFLLMEKIKAYDYWFYIRMMYNNYNYIKYY